MPKHAATPTTTTGHEASEAALETLRRNLLAPVRIGLAEHVAAVRQTRTGRHGYADGYALIHNTNARRKFYNHEEN
jgi:hypothetical protein